MLMCGYNDQHQRREAAALAFELHLCETAASRPHMHLLDPFGLSSRCVPDSHDLKQLMLRGHAVDHSIRPDEYLSNTWVPSFRYHAPHLGKPLKALHPLNQA